MARLSQLRIEARWELRDLAVEANISIATISRIEASERAGTKHSTQEVVAQKIVYALSKRLKRKLTVKDIDGIEIAPPRAGRPKKNKE